MAGDRSTDKPTCEESIGKFLLRRLRELGVAHMFGVAGDFNLELLEQLESMDNPRWVGCCNELNAAYAARTHGLSAIVTTYGVGELSALCGIAGAYSEHLPIVAITGAPPMSEIERKGLLHHTAGDGNFENMMECARQFSVAQARITPQNAVSEIDRCLRACVLQKQPVYLQLPSELAYIKIETPEAPLNITFSSDPEMLEDFGNAAVQRLATVSSVVLLVDADVARVRAALEKWQPFLDEKKIPHSPIITAIQAWLIVVEDPDGNRLRLYTLEIHGRDLKPEEDNPWLQN